MITLQELLELRTDYFKSSKIKLVRHKDSRKEYKDIIKNRAALLEYQKEQGNPVFKNTDYIISFIGQEGTKSLLFGFFKVNGVEKNSQNNKYYYDLEVEFESDVYSQDEVSEFFDIFGINYEGTINNNFIDELASMYVVAMSQKQIQVGKLLRNCTVTVLANIVDPSLKSWDGSRVNIQEIRRLMYYL